MIWEHAGSWSGRGDLETNSFPASGGYLRFTWETSNETKPGEGRFKLILGSSISGRPTTGMGMPAGQVSIETPEGTVNVDAAKAQAWGKRMEAAGRKLEQAQKSGDKAAMDQAMKEMTALQQEQPMGMPKR